MKLSKFTLLLACIFLPVSMLIADEDESTIVIASKSFTENIVLAEIAKKLLEKTGLKVKHQAGLGGSRILWSALNTGEIDVYPEYTGTLIKELYAGVELNSFEDLEQQLRDDGIGITARLGFNNTYIIGMLESEAERRGIESISDLKVHPGLAFGFSNEFMQREDGWPGLQRHYGLTQEKVNGLDHDLAYRGLESNKIDAIDLYSTDAEIEYYKIRSLHDDKHYFVDYYAVYLYRLDAPKQLVKQLQRMQGVLDSRQMIAMNAEVKIEKKTEQQVAVKFVNKQFNIDAAVKNESVLDALIKNTVDHMMLVLISLSAAIITAIPLGILAARRRRIGQAILAIAGILQTIPSLALFVFMIPLLGIGGPPTIAALFIYSLLPIIRNTYAGLLDIPVSIQESAQALGLPAKVCLRRIELPLATRSILAGIKTSAVINVGTATLGALIGAGGYGQPILTGIRLDDTALILQGAIPAALLALLVQGGFEFAERYLLPAPLQHKFKQNSD